MTGQIFLETAEISVSETDGLVYIAIVRTGDLSGAVNVEWATTNDTATAADYSGASGIARMEAGEDRIVVAIEITDDSLSEATESFVLSLINVDSGALQFPRTTRIDILDDENPVVDPPEPPLTSAYTVTEQAIFSGMQSPIALEFLPTDGNTVFVAEQTGLIRTYDLSSGQQTGTLLDLRPEVTFDADRGLMDIALHPDFVNNPYLYAFYVVDPPDTAGNTGNAGPDGAGNRYSHVVRFTLDEATGYTSVVAGSKTVLIGGAGQTLADISGNGAIDSTSNLTILASDIDPTTGEYKEDYLKVDSRSHAGGALEFGPDGALYISTGDGTSFNAVDPRTVGVQDINSLAGKILRVDPLTGDGLADNPFVTAGMDLDTNAAKVYQLGLRNPFSMSFDGEGQLIITDTGWNSWEELNAGGPGANYGWPFYEGGDNGQLVQNSGYAGLSEAAAFYAAVAAGQIVITPAFRAFSHVTNDPGFQVQAITGADDLITSSLYPASLQDHYIFTDITQGEVFAVDINDRRDVEFLYNAGSGFGPAHLKQGPDGYMYYTDIVTGQVGRLLIVENVTEFTDDPNLDQTLTGTAGGFEAFLIDGLSTDFTWVQSADGVTTTVTGPTSTDTLTNFDYLRFTDTEITLGDVTPPPPPPNPVNEVNDIPNQTQYLTGTSNFIDIFVVNGNSADYQWGPTEDQQDYVIWGATGHDLLYNWDRIRFNDGTFNMDGTPADPTDPPPNDAPFAVDDAIATTVGTAITFSPLGNDSDVNGDALTIIDVGTAGKGTVVINPDNTITYTPNGGFTGNDNFAYTIADTGGLSAKAEVTVTVSTFPPPPPPAGNEVNDVPNQTQYLQGTDGIIDVFIIDAPSAEFQWGPTEDQQDHVVWGPTGFDLLYDWDQIRFNDTTIFLTPPPDDVPSL